MNESAQKLGSLCLEMCVFAHKLSIFGTSVSHFKQKSVLL